MASPDVPLALQQALVGLLMGLQGAGGDNVRLEGLTPSLSALNDAMAPLPPTTVAACLPMVMLPLYSVLTLPAAGPGKDGARLKQRTPAEADALVAALRCVQTAAGKAGPRVIQEEPTAFLKLVTQLTLGLSALSASDSTKRVEWWLEEKAVLGALNALVRCWQWGAGFDLEQEREVGQGATLDMEDAALPSLEEVLGDEIPAPPVDAAALALAEEWALLEAQWAQVARVLLHSVGGAVVAQLVQALLDVVGRDRDRDVRLLALQTLEGLVGLLPSPDVWRPFFPGVFSGLLRVVLAGEGGAKGGGGDLRQGSKLGAAALRVALRVTAMLVSPEANAALLPFIRRTAPYTDKAGGAWQCFQAALLAGKQEAAATSGGGSQQQHEEDSTLRRSKYRAMAVPAKMAVRVDVVWARGLQEKLSDYLPLLLRACVLSSSPRIRQELAAGLAAIVGGEEEDEEHEGGVSLLDFEPGPAAAAAEEEEEEEEHGEEDGGGMLKGAARLRVQVLDAVVCLQGDDDPQAAATAQAALRRLLARGRRRLASYTVVAVGVEPLASRSRLLDRVAALLAELPGVAAAVQDRPLRATLRLLKGYMELLLFGAEGRAEASLPPLLTTELEATVASLAAVLEPEKAGAPLQVIDPLPAVGGREGGEGGRGAAAQLGYFRQGFLNLHSEAALGEMRAVLRLLGRVGGAQGAYVVADFVLGRLREGANRMRRCRGGSGEAGEGDAAEGGGGGGGRVGWARERVPLVYTLNHVFQGAAAAAASPSSSSSPSSLEAAVRLWLEGLFLTEGGVWRLPTGQTGAHDDGPSSSSPPLLLLPQGPDRIPVEALDANARLVALLIEGVGDCISALVPAPSSSSSSSVSMVARERCLMLALFPLVEKLGDPHPVVRQAALTTLHRLGATTTPATTATAAMVVPSAASPPSVVGDLLAANLDYLVEALCTRVRTQRHRHRRRATPATQAAPSFPLAPAVLEALVAHAGPTASRALVRELAGVVLGVVDEEAAAAAAAAAGGGGSGSGLWGAQDRMRYSYGMMRVLVVLAGALRPEEGEASTKRKKGRRDRMGKAVRVPAAAYWREKLLAEFAVSAPAPSPPQQGKEVQEGQGKEAAEAFFRDYHGRKAAEAEGEDEEGGDNGGRLLLEIEKRFPEAAAAEEAEDEGEEEEEEDEEDEDDTPTPEEALLLEMVDRGCYFLAQPSLFVQHQALAVLRVCLAKLHAHSRRDVLLPTVHKLWPALMARLHACARAVSTTRRQPGQQEEELDPSWAFLLLGEALELVAALVGLCGDFLSLKFTEELWPVLKTTLRAMKRQQEGQGQGRPSTKRRGSRAGGGGELIAAAGGLSPSPSSASPPLLLVARHGGGSVAEEEEGEEHGVVEASTPPADAAPLAPSPLQRQTLRARAEASVATCLRRFAECDDCFRYTVPLVHDMAGACAFLLSSRRPRPDPRTAEAAVGLFRALGRLDGAAVWPVLMTLAGWDISTRPPTRVVADGAGGGDALPGEVHARELLVRLEQGADDGEEMAWCTL